MKRFIIATATAAALMAGVSAASAQTYYDEGYAEPRGPFVERGVGLQIGPVGIGVGTYVDEPVYGRSYGYRNDNQPRDNSVYESNSFRAQQYYPQSPPGGGY